MSSAFERIARAQAAYARCIDADELERWPDFFTDECFYLVTNADSHREGLAAGMIWALRPSCAAALVKASGGRFTPLARPTAITSS